MSRTRTLQMLLVVSATAWVLILGSLGGMIAMHVLDRPRPDVVQQRVIYEHVYRPQPVMVMTPQGPRCCCPPPPCCPRGHVTYVVHTPPQRPAHHVPWLFLFGGLLGASALVAGFASRRNVVPLQP